MDIDKAIAVYYMWVDRRLGRNNITLHNINVAISKLTGNECKVFDALKGAYLMGRSSTQHLIV